jgi:hypothetical protein
VLEENRQPKSQQIQPAGDDAFFGNEPAGRWGNLRFTVLPCCAAPVAVAQVRLAAEAKIRVTGTLASLSGATEVSPYHCTRMVADSRTVD